MNNNIFNRLFDLMIEAEKHGEVPVSAIIINRNTKEIIAESYNLVEAEQNAIFHAEILAINKACKKINNKYLENLDIYVSLEPCPMCKHAINQARIKNLYFAAYDKKNKNISTDIYGGFREQEFSDFLSKYFIKIRNEQ